MRIKGFVLLGIMIAASIFYFFSEEFKGCIGSPVGDRPKEPSVSLSEKR